MSPALGSDQAVRSVLTRYGASKWEMAHGYTGPTRHLPARAGQALRGIPDTGAQLGSGSGMEMLNWVDPSGRGTVLPPLMRRLDGHWCSDHSAGNTWGFWCKKSAAEPGVHPLPRNRMPYHLQDPHFAIVALSVPGNGRSGVAFQASKAEENHVAELALSNNRPQARWIDADGQRVVLTSPQALAPHRPAVLTLSARPGQQSLRVDGEAVAAAAGVFAPSNFAQLLIGWGFRSYFPNEGFGGHVYGVITGRGSPAEHELALLERYLGTTAGLTLP
ncbi:hypothetical protein JI739_06610 [Ramlibacter sp. AW1]|uniref:Uncharacterized protein n=1 Tax=Ramlibacter aurantiacus TaxID=2801330 RepID=A0A936ZS03_9BURK|nr:hypothetical protein [Ramlibacter aurantiacus]